MALKGHKSSAVFRDIKPEMTFQIVALKPLYRRECSPSMTGIKFVKAKQYMCVSTGVTHKSFKFTVRGLMVPYPVSDWGSIPGDVMGQCEGNWLGQNVSVSVSGQRDMTASAVQRFGKHILSVSCQVCSPGVPLIEYVLQRVTVGLEMGNSPLTSPDCKVCGEQDR